MRILLLKYNLLLDLIIRFNKYEYEQKQMPDWESLRKKHRFNMFQYVMLREEIVLPNMLKLIAQRSHRSIGRSWLFTFIHQGRKSEAKHPLTENKLKIGRIIKSVKSLTGTDYFN